MEPIKEEFLFDTNIFNRLHGFDALKRAEILKRIKEKGIVVCTVPQILGELAGTFQTNPVKGQELCQIYRYIIDDNGSILQPPELLKLELAITFKATTVKEVEEFLRIRGDEFRRTLSELASGQCGEETKSFIAAFPKVKKDHLKHYKESKKLSLLQSTKARGMSFDEILKNELSSGMLKEGIIWYLNNISFPKELIDDTANFIILHIEKMPYFNAAVRIRPAMSYMYLSKNEDPKYGDLVDNGHLIAVAKLDGFVSDDPGALEFARLIHPEKVAISFSEFLQRIEYA